jgi:hypothetical protein
MYKSSSISFVGYANSLSANLREHTLIRYGNAFSIFSFSDRLCLSSIVTLDCPVAGSVVLKSGKQALSITRQMASRNSMKVARRCLLDLISST